jgi:lipoprotein-anchoring transpeptidase ErfK/SrfK
MAPPSTLRASWVATVLAAALAVASPVATGITGIAGAGPVSPTPRPVLTADDTDAFGGGLGTEATASNPGDDVPTVAVPSAPRPAEPSGGLVVRIPRDMAVRAKPKSTAKVVGTMPSGSKYYDVPIAAWVEQLSPDERWGRVEIPYVWPRRHGWIALRGLARHTTNVQVRVDLSEHRITVSKDGRFLFGMPAATGAAASPTPVGEYFVTDRIAFSGGYLGTFAFGISGIQPRLPAGWSGGNQLAIHGTNDPSSIGRSASAGCLRVSERSLARLKPLLQLGTPVIVVT